MSSIFGDEVLGKCFGTARGSLLLREPDPVHVVRPHLKHPLIQYTENLNKEAITKKKPHGFSSDLSQVIKAPKQNLVCT